MFDLLFLANISETLGALPEVIIISSDSDSTPDARPLLPHSQSVSTKVPDLQKIWRYYNYV